MNGIASHAGAPRLIRTVDILKTAATLGLGLAATGVDARATHLIAPGAPAPLPVPAAPGQCPALPLPCHCVAVPPAVFSAPIDREGVPDVFVTTPSAYLDEGIRTIVAQRPSASNATSLFAFNCIDSSGNSALSSVSCVDTTIDIEQAGILSPVAALKFAMDPENNIANGASQVLLDYTVVLKSIYDAPCTHSLLAQGLAYNLDADHVCSVIQTNPTIFNDTMVVTHFQEAQRDALRESLSQACYTP